MKHYMQNKNAVDKRADQILVAFNKRQRLLNPASSLANYSVDSSICIGLAVIEPLLYEAVRSCPQLQKFIDSVDCKIEYDLCAKNTFSYKQYQIFSAFELLQRNQ